MSQMGCQREWCVHQAPTRPKPRTGCSAHDPVRRGGQGLEESGVGQSWEYGALSRVITAGIMGSGGLQACAGKLSLTVPPCLSLGPNRRTHMVCPQCGTENPKGARFCMSCAARLILICAECGFELPPRARFCVNCATPVPYSEAPGLGETEQDDLAERLQRLIPKRIRRAPAGHARPGQPRAAHGDHPLLRRQGLHGHGRGAGPRGRAWRSWTAPLTCSSSPSTATRARWPA